MDYKDNSILLMQGDCLERMKEIEDNSVDSIVTDPPYGISFMNKKWDHQVPSVEIWKECLRVLKPGGYLLSFAGTRTQHRMACNIEDAGFEIRDMIAWIYSQGMPKHKSCLKPALEPITLARKPAKKSTLLNIDDCRVPLGDEKPFSYPNGRGGKGIFGIESLSRNLDIPIEGNPSGRYPSNVIHDGSEEVVDLFPDSNGAGGSLPQVKITGYGDGIGTGKSEYLGGERIPFDSGSGSAARFFYVAKANKKDRNENCEGVITWENVDLSEETLKVLLLTQDISETTMSHLVDLDCSTMLFGKSIMEKYQKDMMFTIKTISRLITELRILNYSQNSTTKENILAAIKILTESGSNLVESAENINQLIRNTTNEKTGFVLGVVLAVLEMLLRIKEKGKNGNYHNTVKPTELMRYLCRLITPKDGIVLDPFMGSGSTGKAAVLEGFNFIGIEMDEGYFQIGKERVLKEDSKSYL